MNNVLKVLIFIAVIFVVLHYRKYRYYTSVYQIDQQELEYIKGDDLYNQHNPLIITFIEDITLKENINEYRLFSLLSFNKNFTNIKSNGLYNVHPNELCLIRPKNEIRIELVNPKFKKYFKKNTNRGVFYNYVLEKENYERVESIEIILREYNILYVPRHWFFKINNGDESIDVFTCDNLVSFFSKRLTTN
tara:strand:+ start:619 stop:1191 length:573 start_codon:yes stop_codon:yes gene_type:complete